MKDISLMDTNDMAFHLNRLQKNEKALYAMGGPGTYFKLPIDVKDLIERLKKEKVITTVQVKMGPMHKFSQINNFQLIAVGLK